MAVWIWAFFRRVQSSRNLEYQLNTNVEFMWLAHGHRIDHSTLADFHKNNASALKKVHRDLVRLAKDLGIIKIAQLYVDATRVKANASRSRMMTAAKATELLKIVDQQIEAFLEVTDAADRADELLDDPAQGEQLPGQPGEFSLTVITQGIQRVANFIGNRLDLRAKLKKMA